MRNLLSKDESIEEVCNSVIRGSYPHIAKQLALQLKEALKELARSNKRVQPTRRAGKTGTSKTNARG